MSEQEREAHTEDLALDAEESESVIGGQTTPREVARGEHEIARLEKEGFVQESCTVEGTMMFNPHTKTHRLVKL